MWAKISNSATKMTCAACLVVAAEFCRPRAVQRNAIRDENLRLSALHGRGRIQRRLSYLQLLGGDPAALANLDSTQRHSAPAGLSRRQHRCAGSGCRR